jgi:PAS domain S-box-containing protein
MMESGETRESRGESYRVFFDRAPVASLRIDLYDLRDDLAEIEMRARDSAGRRFDPVAAESLIAKMRLLEANEAAQRLYEATCLDSLAAALPTLLPPEAVYSLFAGRTADAGRSIVHEVWSRTLSGRRIKVRFHLLRVSNAAPGSAGELFVTIDDLTQVRALGERIKILSTLPDANPDMLVVMNCQAKLVYVNNKTRNWITDRGFTRKEDIFRLLPREYIKRECANCDRVTERQESYEADGRTYNLKISPYPEEARCLLTISDVTDLSLIRNERELFSEAIQSSLHAVIITDPSGTIIHVNKAFERLYGYAAGEVRGRNPNILNPGRKVYRDLGYSQEAYEELFRGLWTSIKNPDLGRWEGIIVNKTREGRLVWVRTTIARAGIEGATYFIAMPVDITDQRNTEEAVRQQFYRTIASLAELRDNETGHHMLRVGAYVRVLAEGLGATSKFSRDIETFAPFHDIGKVGISDKILHARRKLTEDEWAIMKTHTDLGHQLLAGKEGMALADEICWCHHERWDSGGYPRGLRGERIPIAARIATVADVYDALRSDRPYKEACPHDAAVREIQNGSGRQFDPTIVAVFNEMQSTFEEIFSHSDDWDKGSEPI